jgi:hypothetical protein
MNVGAALARRLVAGLAEQAGYRPDAARLVVTKVHPLPEPARIRAVMLGVLALAALCARRRLGEVSGDDDHSWRWLARTSVGA